jgi:hypothetical protein
MKMKKLHTIALIIVFLFLPVLSSAGDLHLGIVSAVKDKVEEAKEKRDKDREKLIDHAPALVITSPITLAAVTGTFNITAEANDDKGITKVEFYINNELKNTDTSFPYGYSWDTSQYSNGTYTITAKAYDTANQTMSSQMSLSIFNDHVPTIKIMALADGTTISATQLISVEATDDKGIAKVEFLIDDVVKSVDTTVPYSYLWDTTQYGAGSYVIKVVAFDTISQTASYQCTVSVIVNETSDKAPTVTITAPLEGAVVSDTVNITAEAKDDVGVYKVEYYIDGDYEGSDYYAPYSFSWYTTYFSSGTHIVKLKVYDAGNQTGTDEHTVTVDKGDPPTITLTAPADGATIAGIVDITATATDDKGISRVEFYLNNDYLYLDYSSPYGYSLDTTQYSNGTYTIKAKVYDTTNQTATVEHTVTVNNSSNGWQISAIDSTLFWPWSSIAVDTSNNPRIAYYEYSISDLKYAKWTGLSWNVEVVDADPTGSVGNYASLALDSSNNPRIAYYDWTKQDLKFASWTGTSWNITVVDSTGSVGSYSSLALDSSDNPHIAYYDSTTDALKYASWTGSAWNIVTVATASYDLYPSLALDSSDNPHIAYSNSATHNLNYAKWTGSAWILSIVDYIGWVSDPPSLKLDSSDNPHIAYYDGENDDLKYAEWSGVSWDITTVDSAEYVGQFPSLALDSSNNPRIAYYNSTKKDLKFAARTGSTWTVETIEAVGEVGECASLTLDSNDKPHISYSDYTSHKIKYATK